MTTHKRGIVEWVVAVATVIGSMTVIMGFAKKTITDDLSKKSDTDEVIKRVEKLERKVKPIPAVIWEAQLLEQGFSSVYPLQMRNAIEIQTQLHGPRPVTKEEQ